jgi:hypothetical protein
MPPPRRFALDKPASRRAFLAAAASPLFAASGKPRVRQVRGEKVSFLDGDRLLFEYRYAGSIPKTYVHPLCGPDGAPITLDSPADHVHHRGLMLAWSDINGFDFWGETNPGRHGLIVHQKFEQMSEQHSQLTSLEHWIAEGRVLLIERRTLRVPFISGDAVWVEWRSDLEAAEAPVTLSAKDHVYNGLGIRFIRSMDDGGVLNSNGTSEIEKANGEPAAWCAYHGKSEKGGMAGAVIFDHPSNPRHPTPFFVMNKPFGYVSAAPTFREPFELQPGLPLRLRYAVASFLGAADRPRMEGWQRRWLSG